jgi:putative salt-induced outer membrane protein YdiY
LMTLNLPISENFSLDVQLSSSIDNDPPDLSKKSNHSFSTNFRYKF